MKREKLILIVLLVIIVIICLVGIIGVGEYGGCFYLVITIGFIFLIILTIVYVSVPQSTR